MHRVSSILLCAGLVVFFCCNPKFGFGQDEEYIKKEYLDLEKIQEEENLGPDTEITQLYIFLVVLNGNRYEAYVTRGAFDLDKDGKKVMDEPNDLDEYKPIQTVISEGPDIKGNEHICYLTALPYYEELFKKEKLKDPFENGDILEIPTSKSKDYPNTLNGYKTIPVMSSSGANIGIERYLAFYNMGTKTVKDAEGNEKQQRVVASYGVIGIKVEHVDTQIILYHIIC